MGRNDSNLEIAYHGDTLEIRWHWGDLAIDAKAVIGPEEEERLRHRAVDFPLSAAHDLAELLGVKATVAALARLAGQLRRWAE